MAYLEPSQVQKDLISSALLTDPFAADLTLGLVQSYARTGDMTTANALFGVWRKLAPNSKIGG